MARRISFYFDEHIGKAVVKGLRQRGVDVKTVAEANMRGATDDALLAFAYQEGRVLFTHDADFLHLHALGTAHAGLVYCHQQKATIGDMIFGLMLIYDLCEATDMVGALEFI